MKLTLVWILSDQEEENSRTRSFLQQEKLPKDCALELLVYAGPGADTSFYTADAGTRRTASLAEGKYQKFDLKEFAGDEPGEAEARSTRAASGEESDEAEASEEKTTGRTIRRRSPKHNAWEMSEAVPALSEAVRWKFYDHRNTPADTGSPDGTEDAGDADADVSNAMTAAAGAADADVPAAAVNAAGADVLNAPYASDSAAAPTNTGSPDGAEDAGAAQVLHALSDDITGDFVTVLEGGDICSPGALFTAAAFLRKNRKYGIVMFNKMISEEEAAPFSWIDEDERMANGILDMDLAVNYSRYPYYLAGTWLRTDLLKSRPFQAEAGMEAERALLLPLCAKEGHIVFLQDCLYFGAHAKEGDSLFFPGIYRTQWYEEALDDFWLPFLAEMQETYGSVPMFIQYHFMFSVKCRLDANWNNRNKHVAEDGEAVLSRIGRALAYIGNDALFNTAKLIECVVPDSLKWIYGILKYGPDFRFQKFYLSGLPYYGTAGILFNRIQNLGTNIVFMDYRGGKLEIDAAIHPILFSMADEIWFAYDNARRTPVHSERYAPVYNECYALTKTMGVSLYKSHSCHVSIPLPEKSEGVLQCFAVVDGEQVTINFAYESHFSRMSPNFKETYWQFGEGDSCFYMRKVAGGLRITPYQKDAKKKVGKTLEKTLEKEMFRTHKTRDWLFLCIRKAYFAMRPILKRKPIWMYVDKIYKGGDSAEYLYKYAKKQNNNFKHYYLIDKHSTDYKRLKKEGYRPLVRGSIKHRLVFLMADMMVISNSTVFAFNDFPMRNSRFVRDLTDFHVCCVQHGMSVQKIAVAQNRFRDNIRLYFCASKYEIENLSKPIYGYEGTDALKLTGVPRYDGLVDRAGKQIMISPTWRMQAAVPVEGSKNEGQERDYNPLFKESDYFRVYNALINDERLIGAAREYGYRIKYVLHPIVSPQAEDFDQNDYVDIVPAVGDMSYEDMFCESALMVTDFSGIQFDFAYMRKPVVYLHHKDIPQHYEEGTFFYDTMGFGEICHDNDELIDLLIEYMQNDCRMKDEYVKRADDFFYYDDHDNCKRIYETMVAYQEENILPKRK